MQTIARKCLVLPYRDYLAKKKEIRSNPDCDEVYEEDVYYLGGYYDPTRFILQINKDVPLKS